jgi:hypothetical protein
VVKLCPEEKLGILVPTNASPTGLAESVANNFFELVNNGTVSRDCLTLFGKAFEGMSPELEYGITNYATGTPPEKPLRSQDYAAYEGTYESGFYGRLEIAREGNNLILHMPARGTRYALTRWNGNKFTYYFAGELAGIGVRGIDFLANGQQVLMEGFKVDGDGLFKRVRTERVKTPAPKD